MLPEFVRQRKKYIRGRIEDEEGDSIIQVELPFALLTARWLVTGCCTCICTNIKPPPLIPSLTHSLGLHSIPILFMSIAVRFCSDDLYEFQNEIARHTWFIVHSFDYFKETIDGKLAFSDVWLFYGPVRIRNRERGREKSLLSNSYSNKYSGGGESNQFNSFTAADLSTAVKCWIIIRYPPPPEA